MRTLKYNGIWDVSLEEVEDLHVINPNDVICEIHEILERLKSSLIQFSKEREKCVL